MARFLPVVAAWFELALRDTCQKMRLERSFQEMYATPTFVVGAWLKMAITVVMNADYYPLTFEERFLPVVAT